MAKRNDMAVKIDVELARKAKIVAAYKDVSLAEYLSEALRPIVERDLVEHARKAAGDSGEPPKTRSPKRSP